VPEFSKVYLAWLSFLDHAEPLIGIPLVAVGLVLVLGGWRLWRAIVVLNLLLVGVGAGLLVTHLRGLPPDWRWLVGFAVVCGLAGGIFHRSAAALMGGLAGGVIAQLALQKFGLYGSVLWVMTAIAFAAAVAWSYSYRQEVQAVLTSAEGGVLIASGVAVILPEIPILHRFFSSMTNTSPFMIGFFILVPTVVGVMMQQADLNRSSSKEAE
jgi:hypothetical protein